MRIGIDLGGTKIEGIALSPSGLELARFRLATPKSYDASVNAIVQLVAQLESSVSSHEHGTSDSERKPSVGIGIPGAIVPETGLVKNANSVWLNGRPLASDLERRLDRPVRVMNDANCFALSEATDGAASGAEVVFGVILGTGVGGGVVINGQCRIGPNLIAGEWGHNPLPWPTDDERPGADCYCGKRGCIESWLSGPGAARDHLRRTGLDVNARELFQSAVDGEAAAKQSLQLYVHRLARSLATVINVLDPDVIVLGGGLSNVAGLADLVAGQLPSWVFSDSVRTRVVRHRHGDSSGVRGAAWLWPSP